MTAENHQAPDRNLAMELVRVTEAAALAAGRWVGRGEKKKGDGAAVDAMRELLSTVSMRGVVVIGEGEKDEAPMLFNGERVGNGQGAAVDLAVDPVDGTRLMAEGRPNAISVIAAADRGSMFNPQDAFYMNKIAVGPEAKGAINIDESVEFALDGVSYEIDLSDANAAQLRDSLSTWVGHARRVGGRKQQARTTSARNDLNEIREWGRANGYKVSDRGRVSADVLKAFDAAKG